MITFSESTHKDTTILKMVFKALVAILVDAIIWLTKIVLVKMMASSFHVATYFDRMKESVFHHYILEALSGPPMEEAVVQTENHNFTAAGSKSLPSGWKQGEWKMEMKSRKKNGSSSRNLDMEKLRQLSMEKRTSAWSMKRLVNYVKRSGLSTITKTVDDFGRAESEINSEWEARNTAKRIFKNVAKPGAK